MNGIFYVDGDISGNSNINLVGNAYISGIIDMSGTLSTYGNVDSRNTVNTLYVDGIDSVLYIGSDNTDTINICNSTLKSVNISYSSTETYTNTINIGCGDDTIYVRGDSITFSTSIHFTDSKIQILDGNTGAGISAYAGLYIRDNSDDSAGFLCINYNRDGFLVKSPESDNILNINTDNITLTGATDYITGNSITTGLLVFKHTDDGTGTGVTVKTVGTFPIDASNIFVKDQTNSTDALQYIPTHTSIAGVLSVLPQNGTTTESTDYTTGAVVVTGGLGVSGAVNTNSSVSAGGVVYCNSAVDSADYTTGSLVVTGGVGVFGDIYTSGNINFDGGLYATGNIESTSSGTGSLVVHGGTGISGNLFVDGSANVAGIARVTNTTDSSAVSNGALVVSGGIGVSGTLNASIINIAAGNDSSSPTSGAIIVDGGIGVGGNVFIGNTLNVLGGVISTDSGSGTLIVAGGTGISGNVSVGGNITVAGNTTVSSSLFVEKIVESLSTVVVGSDNTATIDYAASPSIVYLNVDGITPANKLTVYLTNIPATYTNKLFTVNVIIPTTNYIAAVFVNGVSKTDSLIFNGGEENIFVDSNEVTIQSLTVVFTDNATTPTHVISAVSSYYA
jgi:hypothetical protein